MTKEDVITVLEKELHCHNVYTEKGGSCPDDVGCSECECFVSDVTLHKAIKAAVYILKGGA